MSTIRRARWHAPPPPTPKILNIPRRHHRKTTTKQLPRNNTPLSDIQRSTCRGKLESLFDQERVFSRTSVPIVLLNSFNDSQRTQRRERVEETEFKESNEEEESEKWRFQAEILRAECNFFRMERDIALKKLELNCVQTKRTLRSAVETLVSGKEKIHEGKKMSSVLEEEIEELEEKMKELQRSSGVRDFEFGKSSNFDKQANILQRKLEKLGSEGLAK
ncbi:hypothetical protein IFM89_013053 [Coptis chinensis]|uniref:Uncharacterized protein n=1 Tax=Coptis chinensis TaxID=261450 RepID=A0A835LM84_9MAGN|nr:hypothetical protein IFM89_013053 [Coptis chinensis]